MPDPLQQRALQQNTVVDSASGIPDQKSVLQQQRQHADSHSAPAQLAVELAPVQNLSIQGQGYGEGWRQSKAHDSSAPAVAQGEDASLNEETETSLPSIAAKGVDMSDQAGVHILFISIPVT